MSATFPIGAKVYVDKQHIAIIRGVFPEGSSSFLFPHYKVDFQDGDKNVAVKMDRIGVVKAKRRGSSKIPSRKETVKLLQNPSPAMQAVMDKMRGNK